MTAPSPGILTRFIVNLHYPTEDAYVAALTDAMRTEYRAIVEAGFLLQIDAPDLASARAINTGISAMMSSAAKSPSAMLPCSTPPPQVFPLIACDCTSAGAITKARRRTI
jgi:methionine synthase II (cobalamin-independent)